MHDRELVIFPVTPQRAADLDAFSRAHGTFRWCSCMRWRMPSAQFTVSTKQERIHHLNSLVETGKPVGLLAYDGDVPVGWCSVAPRSQYSALARSRVLSPIDDVPVWSVLCLFVDSGHRHRGVAGALVAAAVDYARSAGAPAIEAYPVEPGASSSHRGIRVLYEAAGFTDVTPPGRTHPVLRRVLTSG